MKLPIGYSNFKKILDNQFYYVDKTLLVKEMLNDAEVILITRPRRFGKTLNMSMLHYFFAAEVFGESSEGLFDSLNITRVGEEIMRHHRKYPVIFLTFKDVKETTFENAYAKLCKLLSSLYSEHRYLLSSSALHEDEKKIYQSVLDQQASRANWCDSLKDLSDYLYRHHGVKPLILIDEYDTPIQSGYLYDYYNDIITLFRNFFGAALKDNPYLFKAVLTGILRVSKESLFSGLNNLKVYSMLHPKYGPYFGFTEAEVNQLLDLANLKDKLPDIKRWYNGYQVGPHVLYNPWSMVNCIQEDGALQPYWVNTSDNALIKDLLLQSGIAFKAPFERLLQGNAIEYLIDENIVFSDLKKNNESAIWSFLLMTGYLKVTDCQQTNQGPLCQLSIPNQEIRNFYRQIIEQWLSNDYGIAWYNQFLNHLLNGDIPAFTRDLKDILEQTVSVHDTAHKPEVFYHGLMIGLTASLHGHPQYEIKSNRESGYGRYDYLILSRDPAKFTLLLEFKQIDSAENKKETDELTALLNQTAKDALKQIREQAYAAEVTQRGIKKMLNVGLAFCGKRFGIAYE